MAQLEIGQALNHPVFGSGVIVQSDEERTIVDFAKCGRKLFVTAILSALIAANEARASDGFRGERVHSTIRNHGNFGKGQSGGKSRPADRCQRRHAQIRSFRTPQKREGRTVRLPQHFGEIVRLLRTLRGLSQMQLGARIDYSRAMIDAMERGNISPTDGVLGKLCAVLRVKRSDLLGPVSHIGALRAHPLVRMFGPFLSRISDRQLLAAIEKLRAACSGSSQAPTSPQSLNCWIRRLRASRRLTLRQLSQRSGVSVTSLEHYERGTRIPGALFMARILRAAGADASTVPPVVHRDLMVANQSLLACLGRMGSNRWERFVRCLQAVCVQQ